MKGSHHWRYSINSEEFIFFSGIKLQTKKKNIKREMEASKEFFDRVHSSLGHELDLISVTTFAQQHKDEIDWKEGHTSGNFGLFEIFFSPFGVELFDPWIDLWICRIDITAVRLYRRLEGQSESYPLFYLLCRYGRQLTSDQYDHLFDKLEENPLWEECIKKSLGMLEKPLLYYMVYSYSFFKSLMPRLHLLPPLDVNELYNPGNGMMWYLHHDGDKITILVEMVELDRRMSKSTAHLYEFLDAFSSVIDANIEVVYEGQKNRPLTIYAKKGLYHSIMLILKKRDIIADPRLATIEYENLRVHDDDRMGMCRKRVQARNAELDTWELHLALKLLSEGYFQFKTGFVVPEGLTRFMAIYNRLPEEVQILQCKHVSQQTSPDFLNSLKRNVYLLHRLLQ